jgi:hypothetical protein
MILEFVKTFVEGESSEIVIFGHVFQRSNATFPEVLTIPKTELMLTHLTHFSI